MPAFRQLPKSILRWIKRPPQLAYAIGLGPLIGRLVLLLTTIGRVTGKQRVTPLQYESVEGIFYVGSARGIKADWVRNILVNDRVEVRVKNQYFNGSAAVITDVEKIIEFLLLRIQNHPRMMNAMLKSDGIPQNPDRDQLKDYASRIVLVKITPNHSNFKIQDKND